MVEPCDCITVHVPVVSQRIGSPAWGRHKATESSEDLNTGQPEYARNTAVSGAAASGAPSKASQENLL